MDLGGRPSSHHPFGHETLDAALPGGGLALGALHEVAGTGTDIEHGSAAALFAAGCLARLPGIVLWVLERPDRPDRPDDVACARLIAEAAKEVSQPDTQGQIDGLLGRCRIS